MDAKEQLNSSGKKKALRAKHPVHVDTLNPPVQLVKRKNNKDGIPAIIRDGRKPRNTKVATVALKKNLLLALEQSLGVVTTACRMVGCQRAAHFNFMKVDPDYKAAYESLADVALDFVESHLHKQIKNGEVASTIFYLKTKGKARGYIERVENAVVIRTALDLSKLSEEELFIFSELQAKMELKHNES